MLHKTTFLELNKKITRPIILFGAGNIAKKTIRKLGFDRISFIVDNSTNLQGTEDNELIVKTPKEANKNYFIVICSTAVSEISAQLKNFGLEPNFDFAISPILNDLLAISELEDLKTEFCFTSGTVPNESFGGGFYKCSVEGTEIQLERVYSGGCYGAIQQGNRVLFVDTDKGLFEYKEGNVQHLAELPLGSRAHGISYNESNEHYYISCSHWDAVIELNKDYKITRRFHLSRKMEIYGEAMHHCNDNLALRNSLYVSMFSSTGNWKNDKFDGCIAEFDIETGKRLKDVASDLYMPHNIKYFDGSLHILDSLPGHLRFNNLSIQGTFPAFTRGLDYAKGLYYVGQSKNRNYSKVLGISNNISIDCGVIVFNPEIKASRFLQFPYKIGEIHSIVVP